jgi:hypothetical protein
MLGSHGLLGSHGYTCQCDYSLHASMPQGEELLPPFIPTIKFKMYKKIYIPRLKDQIIFGNSLINFGDY